MNIIFLDFDGVLAVPSYNMLLARNNMPECDEKGRSVFAPKCVENLRRLIEITRCDIIATSSWKYIDKYDGLLKMWQNRQMPGFLIGTTPNVSKHRGDEIKQWLYQYGGSCSYVIIDDLGPDNFDEDQLDKLVVVNPFYGLDTASAEKAIAILQSQNHNNPKMSVRNRLGHRMCHIFQRHLPTKTAAENRRNRRTHSIVEQ